MKLLWATALTQTLEDAVLEEEELGGRVLERRDQAQGEGQL